jgi:hypothetical protein
VGGAQGADDPGVEGLPGAGGDAGVVERGGDAGVGVVVEETVDLGEDVCRGASGVGGGEGQVEGQAGGLPALEPDRRGDLPAAAQGHVVDE